MELFKISEGITLNVINTDKFKTNYLSVNFVKRLDKEKVSLNALLPQVLIRGTKKHKDLASLKIALDDLYAASVDGKTFKRGDCQICGLNASWLADKYSIDGTKITEGTLDLFREILFEPLTEEGVFVSSYVESEKTDLIDDIRAMINNKNSYAVMRCKEEMCKGERFGISEYGDEESVKKITPKSLYDAYDELLETSRIEIFYVGGGDIDFILNKVSAMFSGRKRRYDETEKTEVITDVDNVKTVTEKISAAQGKLAMGFRTGSIVGEDGYSAFPVFVEMFGNSPVSKLFTNVREKLSLCYYCRAIPDGIKGIMVVTAGIEVANREKTEREIMAQLESVQKGEITEDELTLAKKSLKNAYNELNDSPPALEGWYLTRRLSDLSDTHEEVCDSFMKVTRDEVVAVAKKIKLDTVYFLEGTQSGGEDYDE